MHDENKDAPILKRKRFVVKHLFKFFLKKNIHRYEIYGSTSNKKSIDAASIFKRTLLKLKIYFGLNNLNMLFTKQSKTISTQIPKPTTMRKYMTIVTISAG